MDDEIKDEELDHDLPLDDEDILDPKKKSPEEEVESLDDLEEEELAVDKEDLMDDVEEF